MHPYLPVCDKCTLIAHGQAGNATVVPFVAVIIRFNLFFADNKLNKMQEKS